MLSVMRSFLRFLLGIPNERQHFVAVADPLYLEYRFRLLGLYRERLRRQPSDCSTWNHMIDNDTKESHP